MFQWMLPNAFPREITKSEYVKEYISQSFPEKAGKQRPLGKMFG